MTDWLWAGFWGGIGYALSGLAILCVIAVVVGLSFLVKTLVERSRWL